LAVEEINEAGGILGMKIEPYYGDTQFDPAKGVAAYRWLVEEKKVDVIMGFAGSSVALACMVRKQKSICSQSADPRDQVLAGLCGTHYSQTGHTTPPFNTRFKHRFFPCLYDIGVGRF